MEEKETAVTPCHPPCRALLDLHADVLEIRNLLMGRRDDPESMRRSVFGTVERWGNWMDAGVGATKGIGWTAAVLGALAAVAKAAGLL